MMGRENVLKLFSSITYSDKKRPKARLCQKKLSQVKHSSLFYLEVSAEEGKVSALTLGKKGFLEYSQSTIKRVS
jgi:hypothetical protein